MEKNIIYHGDCIDEMKILPDNSVDMVLTDPPFGTTRNEWDTVVDMGAFWKEIKRVTKKNSAILVFTQMPFTAIAVMSNIKMFRYEWIAEKNNPTGFLNVKRMPLKCHENILVFYEKLPTYNPQMIQGKPHSRGGTGRQSKNYGSYDYTKRIISNTYFPRDVLKVNWQDSIRGLHPTQKPVSLCEYFIKTYSNEWDIILDPFIGSGTTAIACMNTNRNFIGFEMNKGYYDIACKRIEEAKNTNMNYI